MIFNFEYIKDNYNSTYPNSIADLQNLSIENVKTFRYLGDKIKYNEPSTGNIEIDLRICVAEAKFYEMVRKFTNFKIHVKTRVLILNSIVRSRLTDSCPTWNVNQTQMNRINSAYVGMLTKLVRNGFKTEDFRFVIPNKEILRIGQIDDIPIFVAKQQTSYILHI